MTLNELRTSMNVQDGTVSCCHMPDLNTITPTSGTLAGLGATNILALSAVGNVLRWRTNDKLRVGVFMTLDIPVAGTFSDFMAAHNALVLNSNVPVTGQGIIILSFGLAGSGADVIVNSDMVRNGVMRVSVASWSKEFLP